MAKETEEKDRDKTEKSLGRAKAKKAKGLRKKDISIGALVMR